jgi:hypothetical protein
MSESITDFARKRLDELDAAATGLGEKLQVINAERAKIYRLLGGKPTKVAPPSAPIEPPAGPAAEKPARGRKAALGAWKDEAPGQEGILAAVVNGAPPA